MARMTYKFPETPIIEVICDDEECKLHRNGKDDSFLVSVAKDTWVFPWKAVSIYTGITIRIPNNTMALFTGCPWILEDKIHVHPQVLPDGSCVYPVVSKIGIFPRKLKKGTYVGILTLVNTKEAALVHHERKDDLD